MNTADHRQSGDGRPCSSHPPCDAGARNTSGRDSFFFGVVAGHGGIEPGAGVPPGAVGGGQGDVEAIGRLLQGQAAEEAQLDELGLERVVDRELLQGLVQGQDVLAEARRR